MLVTGDTYKHFLCSRLGFAGFIYISSLDPQSKPVQRKLWLVWPSIFYKVSPNSSGDKESTCNAGLQIWFLGREDRWQRKWHPFLYFCLENPRRKKPSGLQSMGSQRVRHNWATEHSWAHISIQALFTMYIQRFHCFQIPQFDRKLHPPYEAVQAHSADTVTRTHFWVWPWYWSIGKARLDFFLFSYLMGF